ncbi:unnamed protein product [Rotaria socialis]|uniref:Uncharacterized protein n=1 Tax=Rotaria socialis TaxID=392032 RepID=A0A821I266_9BILA|nr:unnamed protein product [Rotaria socialis]
MFLIKADPKALLTPSIINDRNSHHKQFKRFSYTLSEKCEVEEVHSDSYIVDDEKNRAKHDQSYGNFSSESENREKLNNSSPKNDDEGGHVLHDQPASRESILNTEPKHEWLDLK